MNSHLARNVLEAPFSRLLHQKANCASSLQAGTHRPGTNSTAAYDGPSEGAVMPNRVPSQRKSGVDCEFCLMISVNEGGRWADLGAGAGGVF